MPHVHSTRIHLQNPVPGLTVHPPKLVTENYLANTEGEISVENWQLWFEIIADGSNPFLSMKKNQGWRFCFVRATAAQIFIPPDVKDSEEYVFFLHPASSLRAIILTETMGETPGLWMFCRVNGLSDPKFWFGEPLLLYNGD